MRILQQLVNLERERTAKPSWFRRVLIWFQYRLMIWYGLDKIINKKEYPELIALLRDFATVISMCTDIINKDISKVNTYMPVLKYELVERHASDDHKFLNHDIHYYNMILTHPVINSVYNLSFNSDDTAIDTVEYEFTSTSDKNKFLNNKSLKLSKYTMHNYEMNGKEYNELFTAIITIVIEELIKLIEKEGINP